jgi:hypothetical protein
VPPSVDLEVEGAMAYVDWAISGPSISNCNCDFGCPCQFNALPTHGNCRAMTALKIEKGHFGGVDLSGLAFCATLAWPGPIHLGGGEVFVVISDRASPAQRDAILTILAGKETEPGATIFNVFAPTFAKMHDPAFAPIEFDFDLEKRTGRVRIAGVIDTNVGPILNPVTGKEHRVRVALPQGFEYKEAEYASGATSAAAPIGLELSGTHAHLFNMNMTGAGVV